MEQCTLDKPDLGQCTGDRSDQTMENVQKIDLIYDTDLGQCTRDRSDLTWDNVQKITLTWDSVQEIDLTGPRTTYKRET